LAEARAKAKALMAERTLGQHQAKTIKFEEAYELFKSQHCARKNHSGLLANEQMARAV